MKASEITNDAAAADHTLRFVLWSLDALQLEAVPAEDDCYVVHLPVEVGDAFGGSQRVRFSTVAAVSSGESAGPQDGAEHFEQLSPDGGLVAWLCEQLNERGPLHAAPRSQPESVHELTPRLFGPYSVENGRVHLAGCRLEDIPFFRITLRIRPVADGPSQLQDVFVAEDGQLVDEQFCALLGLDDVRPLPRAPQRIDPQRLQQQLGVAEQRAAGAVSAGDWEVVAAVVAWCKYARIKISFVIGEGTQHIEFAGWARSIADGRLAAPPFVCPESGVESYHLAADDDGRVTAVEAIAECEDSGRRVLSSAMATCSATGRRVHPSLTEKCPVSGQIVARSAFVDCSMCCQRVSPAGLQGGRCSACRGVKPVSKADPRMARILDEHAGLDRWRRWKIAETDTVYVLVASAFFRRLLVVIDRESLEPSRVATGTRIGAHWSDATGLAREELLG